MGRRNRAWIIQELAEQTTTGLDTYSSRLGLHRWPVIEMPIRRDLNNFGRFECRERSHPFLRRLVDVDFHPGLLSCRGIVPVHHLSNIPPDISDISRERGTYGCTSWCMNEWSYTIPHSSNMGINSLLVSQEGAVNPSGFFPQNRVKTSMLLSMTLRCSDSESTLKCSWV